jgi:hypothetical protein
VEQKLLEIIASHQSLDNKLRLMSDVNSMFEQIRLLRQENRKLIELVNQIKGIVNK